MKQQGQGALPQAFFLPAGPHSHTAGQRFCLFHPPAGAIQSGRVLYLHPFAEELNCTRRMVAQQARAMAAAGYAVLQIDLTGCGDSTGDFADATWNAWLEDAALAHGWLSQFASGPLWLWGMRSGALLATGLLKTLPEPANLLLWQPVVNGQQVLQQFLRLHSAGQWMGAGKSDEQSPSQRLAMGQSVDIAGYTVSPEMAASITPASLQPPDTMPQGRLIWIDITKQTDAVLSPSSEQVISAWRQAGWQTETKALVGPSFWQTVSTENAPTLISATLAAMLAETFGAETTARP